MGGELGKLFGIFFAVLILVVIVLSYPKFVMSLHWKSLKAKIAAKHNYDFLTDGYSHFVDQSVDMSGNDPS